jgi:TRAP-type C4-dicarboxylate transport system permease small subunit
MAGLGRRIEAIVHAVSRAAVKIPMVALSLMALLVGADVVGRYVFNHAIKGVMDIVELSLVFIVFLATADVAVKKSHIKIDLVTSKLSQGLQTIMNCVTSLAGLVIVALITWQTGARGWYQILHPTLYTTNLEMPLSPFLLVAALGCLLLSLVLAVDTVSYISQAWREKLKR